MTDKELFREVFHSFQEKYAGLEMRGTMVLYNGAIVMNTDGYNLLYNLSRLCSTLKNELL